ncbi:hypothetical protein BDV39DRAFT_175996 [Aspergillus sergii]|uniref:Transmembrane protein n=1 Tax=Aspergillus sergii TaxID=1034303 RepID=A0A5N6X150_9EURO|nr:hypothetical protein BDV39DRAFT_175996 [Aspergillus sergii]
MMLLGWVMGVIVIVMRCGVMDRVGILRIGFSSFNFLSFLSALFLDWGDCVGLEAFLVGRW